MQQLKPSRTFTIAMYAITAILIVALAGFALVAFVAYLAPDQLPAVVTMAPVFGTVALALAGAGGAGAGSMGIRDYGSGGLTSSGAAAVLRGHALRARPPGSGPGRGSEAPGS